MEVARAGLGTEPPVEPPRVLRPLLRFRRLSASALEAVRRALEEDDEFRRRVVEAIDEGWERRLGETGRLFLLRPEGWDAALRRLEAEQAAGAAAAKERTDERIAQRRLRLVEDEARRLEEHAASLRAQLAKVRAELLEERRLREEAQGEAAALAAGRNGLERERDAAHRRASTLETELARLRYEQEAAAGGHAAPHPGPGPEPTPGPPPVVAPPGRSAPAGAEVVPGAAFAVGELRAAIADAGTAAAVLGRALDAAARALGSDAAADRAAASPTPRSSPPTPAPSHPRAPAGRLPVALPPGLFDDDPAAADHLVRVRGCVLVVDGYNASLRRWPQLPIAEQRRRLVDAAAGLAARCGPDVHIVFDGDGGRAHGSALARRGVHVRFSAREVEADDVILDQVDRLPATRPVVVATDDRRVRREAAARGANVITQEQLFSLL